MVGHFTQPTVETKKQWKHGKKSSTRTRENKANVIEQLLKVLEYLKAMDLEVSMKPRPEDTVRAFNLRYKRRLYR